MRLRIRHETTYTYDAPVPYALLQVRLSPKAQASQRILSWTTEVEGGRTELRSEDHHRNTVDLVSCAPGTTRLVIRAAGEVETTDTDGIVGVQGGFVPLWMFGRVTPLTRAGTGVRRLVQALPAEGDPVALLHALMAAIRNLVAYETGVSHVGWTAEDALAAGHGVCQDMAHVFVAAARAMGLPARYVSGYLLMDGREDQDATHAWAEAHVDRLGWIGFDVANGISPDARHVRVATGLDYAEAAPVSGMRMGTAAETMQVAVAVAQVQQ